MDEGYAEAEPFTYRSARAVFAGTGRDVRVNLAVLRTAKPHVTRSFPTTLEHSVPLKLTLTSRASSARGFVTGVTASPTSSGANSWPRTKRAAWRGCYLVISDAHAGLNPAVAQQFNNSSWQRCRVHFMRNLHTAVAAKRARRHRSSQDHLRPHRPRRGRCQMGPGRRHPGRPLPRRSPQ